MSQSFLSGRNPQGKFGLRDTPRFRRPAPKTSSLTASQNQSLLEDLHVHPQPVNAVDPASEPTSGAPSAFKKQTLAQLMPKQGRQPPSKNVDSSLASTVTTPGIQTDGQKVKQMIKIVNKQNQQK